MGKRRRTRDQKIIAQLKRELRQQQTQLKPISAKPKIEPFPQKKSVELPFDYQPLKDISTKSKPQLKEEKVNLYTYSSQLIKKDLFKTLYLSTFFFTLVGFIYWYFEVGGEKILGKLIP